MKIWIKTEVDMSGTSAMPYLSNQDIMASMMQLDDGTCLCRIAGMPSQIDMVIADSRISQQTDDQAYSMITSKYPGSSLENLDINDPELDDFADTAGLSSDLRAQTKMPSAGNQILQDQENYLMAQISTKIGKSKTYWDTEAKAFDKHTKGIDIENAVIDGRGDAHEFVMSRIRNTSNRIP